MLYKSIPFLLLLVSVGCFGAAEPSLAQARQEALKRRVQMAWSKACADNDLAAMKNLRDQVIAFKIEEKSEVDTLMAALRETSPEVEQAKREKELQRTVLMQAWKKAFSEKNLKDLYELAAPVVAENIVAKAAADSALQEVTEICATEDRWLGAEQHAEQGDHPLHAVFLERLQTVKTEQERAEVLRDAFKQFVADDKSQNYQRILDVLNNKGEEFTAEKLSQIARGFMAQPFVQCIQGKLDLECNLLAIYGSYGLWRPMMKRNEITIATAIRWLKDLIRQTNEKGKSVEPIINLCHDKLNEKPLAFNLAAACLYEQLVKPLKLKKRTNVIVQLIDAQLFDGTPYFDAVEKAAAPTPELPAPAPAPAIEPGYTDHLPTERLDDENPYDAIIEQALDTGNIETALEIRQTMAEAGLSTYVLDERIALAQSALTPSPVPHDGEAFYSAPRPEVDELYALYVQALENHDVDFLRGQFVNIVDNSIVSQEELQTRIAEIESLRDLGREAHGHAVAPAPAALANTGWRAWAGNVVASAGNLVTNNPTTSAVVAGSLAALAFFARR